MSQHAKQQSPHSQSTWLRVAPRNEIPSVNMFSKDWKFELNPAKITAIYKYLKHLGKPLRWKTIRSTEDDF